MKYYFSIEGSKELLRVTAFMNLKNSLHEGILMKLLNPQNLGVGPDDRERSLATGSRGCLPIINEHAGTLGGTIAMFLQKKLECCFKNYSISLKPIG